MMKDIINHLNLEPHPEGGYFKETYRSELELSSLPNIKGSRSCSTGIYYMLTRGDRSHLHKIKSDEMWHFYSGDPLDIHLLDQSGAYFIQTLGSDLGKNQMFQFVVPAGVWFGAEVQAGGQYSLVGCTVAPGFDFEDFEMAKLKPMLELYPQHQEFLNGFCLKN